jgi:hypothetical protein
MTDSVTGPAVAASHRRQQNIFVSYARQDRDRITSVVEGLRLLGNDVWFDEELSGGQAWWDTILQQIRECDVFVQAITPSSARSEACQSERRYAAGVGRPILPVFLEQLPTSILPSDLAVLQAVDYVDEAPERRAFRLAGALQKLPAAPPLPAELPPSPPVPLSYLVELSDQLRTPSLSLDEQMQIVSRLRKAVGEPDDHAAALELLRQLKARSDLFYAVSLDVDRLRAEIEAAETPSVQQQPQPKPDPQPAPPPAADGALEAELQKWNWGAFLLVWIWGIGHNVYRSFLTLIPFYGLYEWYLLGRNGNRWAWENGRWESVDAFRVSQRKWATWGVVVVAFLVVVVIASGSSGS